jgi:biopolymer transport protein ExbD
MNGYHLVSARRSRIPRSGSSAWTDTIARRVIEHAARRAPAALSQRLREEWLAALAEYRGPMARLKFALGCWWAANLIADDGRSVIAPAVPSPASDRIALVALRQRLAPSSRAIAASAGGPPLCEMNTTPLIDVLLVLLVTLIITLPLVNHAIGLQLPQSTTRSTAHREVIDLDIEFDGAVVWNGSPVASLTQLEGYFRAESRKSPQPEIHLRADPYAKYGVVAKVLAAAQRNRLRQIGFVDTAKFAY